jgi:dihydrofolate reductase
MNIEYVGQYGTSGYAVAAKGKIINDVSDLDPETIVAGGAKTYELFLPYITEFFVTHVNGSYDGDTFMSAFEHLYNKQEVVKKFDGHKVVKYSR